ncbi:MAG: hypothetical protein IJ600_06005 [Lachnospiraceae bacterium]|nr:hypothetical protein [Lachnospiraceae bacterium]
MKKRFLAAGVLSFALLAGCGSAEEVAQQAATAVENVTRDASTVQDVIDNVAGAATDFASSEEFANLKKTLNYRGGLYISDPNNDLQMALFENKDAGAMTAVVTKLGKVYYGLYHTEDATLEDGTAYTKLFIEAAGEDGGDKEFGYHFYEDGSGVLIDEDGTKYEAKPLDESAALDMVVVTFVGFGSEVAAGAETEEDYSPAAELERIKEGQTYMGGLYISDPQNDLQMSLFRNTESGDLVVVITKLDALYYGIVDGMEEATTADGRTYSKFTLEGKEFGYYFEEAGGILVDEDGTVYEAKDLDESAAWDMVLRSLGG